MAKVKTVKGTRDILEKDFYFHDMIENIFEEHCLRLNFRKISTPIIEPSMLFLRTLGDVSDIVSKEMYTFIDQGKESLTLRPEGTAPVARALISNSLHEDQNQKFFYSGPMFRRENPQAGRLRQFTQVGVEYFNQESILCDLEIILLADSIIKSLGIEKKVTLQINSIGDLSCRKKYTERLIQYLEKFKNDLSKESQIRLIKNPLRILDSKNETDQKILKTAPNILDFLDLSTKDNYEELKEYIEFSGLNYEENSKLVRGLDYYNNTVFEFVTNASERQNTIIAGGRYDQLVNIIGGKEICGVGWAAGIERIVNLIRDIHKIEKKKNICIFSISKKYEIQIFKILNILKHVKNCSFHPIFKGNFKKKLIKANKLNAMASLIIGDKEFEDNKLIFKNFLSGQQELVEVDAISNFFEKMLMK